MRIILPLVAIMAGTLFFVPEAYALTISPVKVEVSGDPGQTLRGEIELYNEQADTKTLYSSFENFEPSGDTGSPHFVGADSGLATWLSTNEVVSVESNQKQKVPYTITIPADAEPGGYFAAVFFGAQNPRELEGGEVAIGGKLGMLILLRVEGNVPESGGVSEFGEALNRRVISALPAAFSYRFANTGGDRVVPLGDVVITNIFGGETARIKANVNEGSVLPASSRKFETFWGDPSLEAKGFFDTIRYQVREFHFGVYTATLDIVWGEHNQHELVPYWFIFFPWQLVIAVLAILIALAVGLRQYNAWIIARSRA